MERSREKQIKNKNVIVRPVLSFPEEFFTRSASGRVIIGFWSRFFPKPSDFESGGNQLCEIFLAGKVIGCGCLRKVDEIAKSAELSLMAREKGKIWNLIIALSAFGFREMNLNRIFISFSSEEIELIKAAKLAGYRNDGKLRSYFYRNGRYEDLIMVSLLKEDFIAGKYGKK